ncbi:hypothetical protein NZL82_16220, partial [Sphingomonas sanguinis]|uniref:SGNH/GDSL hydrolase family protein n=1 Tax=Sphingomonas sp. LC-1 TaxID=3110957 RepID=UPI0021BA78B9
FTGTSKALAFLGDSLMDGSNDLANYIGGNGYGPRAVVPTGLTGIVAHMKLTRVGARASDLSQNTKMLAWLKYFNILYLEPGTNDLANVNGGNATAAATISSLQSLMTSARSAGVNKIIGCLLIPRLIPGASGTTDSYATEAGQTSDANFGVGTRGETVNNQWLAWLADGTVAALDRRDKTRGTDPWKWVVNGSANYGTGDGTHYTTAIAQLMATDTRAAIDSVTL